ncbi:carboxylesterase family protein, partial [Chitinimonas sp.]|uniref:carboxylesterase family protein n=1 Tax=Chitinimonas sp. TaxID=1934313 RepID=UPI002F94479A
MRPILRAIGLLAALAGANGPALAKPVETEAGLLEGLSSKGLHIYKGVPYAQAPVGERRWREPAP